MKVCFTCQCEKEDKKAYGFQISHFYGSFSDDITALKGLIRIMKGSIEYKIFYVQTILSTHAYTHTHTHDHSNYTKLDLWEF